MPKFNVTHLDVMKYNQEENSEPGAFIPALYEIKEVYADGYAVDNNSNLFFFNEVNMPSGGPQSPPKPTTTFAKGQWYHVEKG